MRRFLILPALLIAGTVAAAEPPARPRGEFLRMFDAIMSGQPPVNGVGWFGPSQMRFNWDRLKARDKNGDGRISAEELGGRPELFVSLDRDTDGAVTAEDLDWSDNSLYARQLNLAMQLLRQGDRNGNRKLTKEEWEAMFDRVAKDKKDLEAEDLRRLLFPPSRPSSGGGGMPPREVFLYGLLTGEIGSGAEGPKLDAIAPDFTLKSPDEKSTITLSDFKGKKPVALIFGSFT